MPPEQVQELGKLEYSKLEYTAKLNALESSSAVTDYTDLISQTESEITRLNILVNEALLYAGTRAELTFANLKMNRTEVVLSEVVKSTGELRDCFRFSYDGRDYKCLSLSEKIKAGLEVSELIKRLSGRNYPVFVDNTESLCVIDNIKPCGQLIFSRVTKGENLKVTYKDSDNIEVRKAG